MAREFLPPDHPHDVVTPATLAAHRKARLAAEQKRNGEPRDVQYEGVPAELLNTTDVVELVVRPTARRTHLSFAASDVPVASVGEPTHFASHAWGRLFGQLVAALAAHFSGAVASEVYVWLDIFAINQDDGRAMLELDGARATQAPLPLRRARHSRPQYTDPQRRVW